MFGKRADAQVDSRQIQPLARTQLAPDKQSTLDVVAFDLHHLQLNAAVVQEQDVALLDDCGQTREVHEDTLLIADDFVRGQRECIAPLQLDRLFSQLPNPNLRARKVGHDRHAFAGRTSCTAKIVDRCFMPGKIAMGEVEAGDIHPGMQHLQHDLGRVGCRSDRTHELGFAGGKRHGSLLLVFQRCLARHGLHRLLHALGIPEIIVADRFQILVEFVYQRDTGGNVQLDDIGIGNPVEILEQRTQAVAVRHEQHAIPATNDRRDAIVPTWQESR